MNLNLDLESEEVAILRQREFPQMLRDLVDEGCERIEIVIDARTASKLAQAVELYNAFTLPSDETIH
jgi:hypothetical protein